MADSYKAQSALDISYHYPPELLELLCDAVPALFRSKQGVIDFFVGAGVPNKFLGDWKIKLKQDKDSVKKHEIARSVLCRLNDAGEPALGTPPRGHKANIEFDDFSSCWENDRYKAQGLVSQIQKLVNVKDSFTRINLEREKRAQAAPGCIYSERSTKQKEAESRGHQGFAIQIVR